MWFAHSQLFSLKLLLIKTLESFYLSLGAINIDKHQSLNDRVKIVKYNGCQ